MHIKFVDIDKCLWKKLNERTWINAKVINFKRRLNKGLFDELSRIRMDKGLVRYVWLVYIFIEIVQLTRVKKMKS